MVVAALLNPIFVVPFTALLGRTVFIAMMLLLAFTLAGQWRLAWLPRWVVQALAVALTAPLATFIVYLLSVGGDVQSFLHNEARVAGFLWITGSGLFVGTVLALAALYRERDAQARAQALQFALEKATLERQALDARLATCARRSKPHFLFNTLANVQALVESGSPRAAPVLQSLVAYLRAAMPQLAGSDETLGAEANRVRAYLELMHLRMPDRLGFEVALDPAVASERFPSMGLLTLVENAIRHGIDPGEQGGRIEVGARRDAVSGELRVCGGRQRRRHGHAAAPAPASPTCASALQRRASVSERRWRRARSSRAACARAAGSAADVPSHRTWRHSRRQPMTRAHRRRRALAARAAGDASARLWPELRSSPRRATAARRSSCSTRIGRRSCSSTCTCRA